MLSQAAFFNRFFVTFLPSNRTSLRFLTVYPPGSEPSLSIRSGQRSHFFFETQHSVFGSLRTFATAETLASELGKPHLNVVHPTAGSKASMVSTVTGHPRALGLLLAVALAAGGCSGDPVDDPGSSAEPQDGASSILTDGAVEATAAADVTAPADELDEFDDLDDAAREQKAADLDRLVERATWTLSGLDAAVGTDRADEVFDAANAGIRTELAAVGVQLGGVEGLEAFGTSAPVRLDSLSDAQGASLFGAVMIASLSADAAAGLVDGVHTGSGTENGVTRSATRDTGTVSIHQTSVVDGVTITIDTSVKVAPCPDASGRVVAEGSMAASTTKDGVGHRFNYAAAVQVQVDDNAEVASTTQTFTAEQGDAGPGGEKYVSVSGGANGDYDVQARGDLPQGYAQQAVTMGVLMSSLLASRLVQAAETRWKSGKCVKLEPTVSDGPTGLRPGAAVTITAAPRSVMDGGPAGGTVTATLTAGRAGVEPAGSKVKADASFTYTAPPEAQQTGDVSLEARSRRGVAKASLHFDTYPLAFVAEGGGGDFKGTGVICDLREPFTISGTGLTLSFSPSGETGGSYTLSGKAAGATWSGGGTYKVKLNSSRNSGRLRTLGTNTITTPLGQFSDTARAAFTLRAVHACD